jgi:hypothetical protein
LLASSRDAKLVRQVSRPEREHPRYAHEAAITFHALDREIAGRSRNVSRGGLCAEVAEAIPAGTSIEIDLQLVFGEDRHSEPLRLPARIAWCTAIDDHHQVGVQFLPMHEETAADLMMFLRYLDGRGALQPVAPEAAPEASPPGSIDERFG